MGARGSSVGRTAVRYLALVRRPRKPEGVGGRVLPSRKSPPPGLSVPRTQGVVDPRPTIRALERSDAPALWQLRLDGLESSPDAFSSTATEHQRTSVDDYWVRLRAGSPDAHVFGAFRGAHLVGMVRITREADARSHHIGMVESLFVRPEARGMGIGRQLVARAIAQARLMGGLTTLVLTVALGQAAARKLYLQAGFRQAKVPSSRTKDQQRSIDEETMVLDLKPSKPV
jgi:GNAT superfamily N-acetyltransferase